MSIKWNLDKSHAHVQFKVKHMVISTVSGEFTDFDATVETEDENFKNPHFEFTAKVHSIDTKMEMRDNHLKGDDFFHAEKYPEISFKSTDFDGEKIKGVLTIRDVTQPIVLDVDFGGVLKSSDGSIHVGFDFTGSLNRKDYGMSFGALTETGGAVVSDKIKLAGSMEFLAEK